MAKRTDVHRPSAINPSEYEFVACDYVKIESLGDCEYLRVQRELIKAHMARTGGTYSHHEHGGNCMVCGSVNAIYTSLFYHEPTNTYVRVGEDCAQKLDMGGTHEMSAFRTQMKHYLEYQKGKTKAAGILKAAGLERAWEIYAAADKTSYKYEEITITDIIGKLVKYGSVSDRAQNYLGTLLTKIDGRAEREAQRAAENAAAADCPTGRVTITGTVISIKVDETSFGVKTRMLVKADSGFKVYGSHAFAFEKGDRVTFKATVEPSKNDPKFGFFKFPKNGDVLEAAARPENGQVA